MSSLSCATIFKWRNMFGKFECKMCYLYYMGGGCLLNIDKLHFEPYVLNIFNMHSNCIFPEYNVNSNHGLLLKSLKSMLLIKFRSKPILFLEDIRLIIVQTFHKLHVFKFQTLISCRE